MFFLPKKRQYNTSTLTDGQQETITITHPFSPLKGRSYTFVKKTKRGGKDRLACIDEAGNSRVFPIEWTNYRDNSTYGELPKAALRESGDFRYKELKQLADMLDGLKNV